MTGHDDDLLARLVTGELDRDAEPARELFARRPDLRARYDELVTLRSQLDRAGTLEARAIETACAETTSEDRTRVRAALAGRLSAAAASDRKTGARRWLFAAAVLAAVTVGSYLAVRSIREGRSPEYLNDRARGIELAPADALREGVSLAWRSLEVGARLQRGERWNVRLRAIGDVGPASLLLEFPTDEATWTPSAEELRGLPSEVLWSVQRLSADKLAVESSPEVRLPVLR